MGVRKKALKHAAFIDVDAEEDWPKCAFRQNLTRSGNFSLFFLTFPRYRRSICNWSTRITCDQNYIDVDAEEDWPKCAFRQNLTRSGNFSLFFLTFPRYRRSICNWSTRITCDQKHFAVLYNLAKLHRSSERQARINESRKINQDLKV